MLYMLYTLYTATGGAGQCVRAVYAYTSRLQQKYTAFSYSKLYSATPRPWPRPAGEASTATHFWRALDARMVGTIQRASAAPFEP